MNSNYLFSSESVTEGHPDKISDQISDAILDAILKNDPDARVACETMVTTGLSIVTGEITTSTYVDISEIVRNTIKEIGYSSPYMGFNGETCAVITSINKQSLDISKGINPNTNLFGEQGAGDQGIMFGYACNETPEFMPMPISLAHKLAYRLANVRKNHTLEFLRPDGKTQVTIQYENMRPKRIEAIVIAAQHNPEVKYEFLKEAIIEEVIRKIIPSNMIDRETKIFINTTGRFVIGGPHGDCGVTGRKIIVDTYGGRSHHGGGCFSGKDPSKVDRSGSYYARYVAKNIVAAGLASYCELQLAYAIGIAHPISIMIDTYGSGIISDHLITKEINKIFDFRPASIIAQLNLKRPIYKKTAVYGHFGREEETFTWEKIDQIDKLKAII